jgi:hypothetical protein
MVDFSPLFPSFCHVRRLIVFVNGRELGESWLRQNAYSPTRCMQVKLAINVKFYLSVSRFETGYSLTILLPSSYHIIKGSGFSTMQLVELALYSNGARFLRYSFLELLSLSLSLHPPSALIW